MNSSDHFAPPLSRTEKIGLLLALLLFIGQAALSSPHKSASFDEQYHLATGYAYLKTGDFRLSLTHPALVNLLSAVPLLLRDDVHLPLGHPGWAAGDYFSFGQAFLWHEQSDPQSLLEWGRWPIIGLATLLVLTLFLWARQMISPQAGWLALFLAIFDPNLIANGRLITTDLGVTCFLLLTIWRLWHWQQRPSVANLLWVGMCAGLTMASKYTGLIIWPMVGSILLLSQWQRWRQRPWQLLTTCLTLGLTAFMTVWAIYSFRLDPFPGTAVPFPASFYLHNIWQTFRVIEDEPLASFLLGQTSRGGWWYYFPITLVLKTSLPLLILTAVGLFGLIKQKKWGQTAVLWIPPLLFLLLVMVGNVSVGYRHILPLVPFLILIAASSLASINRKTRWPQWGPAALALLLLWQSVGTLRLFPHQEAFFNELAGGPSQGGQLLSDSNIDWGQDLPALRQLMAERGIEAVNLAYFGTAVPEAYGISYNPLPSFLHFTAGAEINSYNPYTPPPGWYAISQTSLRLGLMLQNNDIYAYFAQLEPVDRAGYSINLYQVSYPAHTPIDRVVITDTAVADLSPQELGVLPGHRLITKWRANDQTEIVPVGQPFHPPTDFRPVEANFADLMSLVGYVPPTAVQPGHPATLTLIWQRGATAMPMPAPSAAPPLAAFVHLSGADPSQIVAQYDGWQTAVGSLEAGDYIIQPVQLLPPPEMPAGDYFWRVGLYSPQNGQRFALTNQADFVTLDTTVIIE